MHRSLSLALLLSACGPIPVQMSSQKQSQSSKQEQAQEVAQDQTQSSAHQSAAKQGTNSMPVIIICNTNNSPGARCATQPEDAPIMGEIKSKIREGARK
jgi:hypothetical protein